MWDSHQAHTLPSDWALRTPLRPLTIGGHAFRLHLPKGKGAFSRAHLSAKAKGKEKGKGKGKVIDNIRKPLGYYIRTFLIDPPPILLHPRGTIAIAPSSSAPEEPTDAPIEAPTEAPTERGSMWLEAPSDDPWLVV